MAGYGQDRRLEALEEETPEHPAMVVVRAKSGEEAEAVARYYAETPEDERAELIVVIVEFSSRGAIHA